MWRDIRREKYEFADGRPAAARALSSPHIPRIVAIAIIIIIIVVAAVAAGAADVRARRVGQLACAALCVLPSPSSAAFCS